MPNIYKIFIFRKHIVTINNGWKCFFKCFTENEWGFQIKDSYLLSIIYYKTQKYWEKNSKMVSNQLVDKSPKHRKTCTSQLYMLDNLHPKGPQKRQNKEGPQDNNIKIRSHLSLSLSLFLDTPTIGRNWVTSQTAQDINKPIWYQKKSKLQVLKNIFPFSFIF